MIETVQVGGITPAKKDYLRDLTKLQEKKIYSYFLMKFNAESAVQENF